MNWFVKKAEQVEREALTLGEDEVDKIARRVTDLLMEEVRREFAVVLKEILKQVEREG